MFLRLFTFLLFFLLANEIFPQCYFHKLYRYKGGNHFDAGTSIVELDNGSYLAASDSDYSPGNAATLVVKVNQCGDTIWQKTHDLSPSGAENASTILKYSNDNYNLIGHRYSPFEGASDGFLYTIDSNGSLLNDTSINIGFNDRYSSSIIDGQDIITTGHFNNQVPNAGMHLTKLDSLGNVIWSQVYDTTKYYFYPKVNKAYGSGYLISTREEYIAQGTSRYTSDIVLIRTDKQGNKLWEKRYQGLNGEAAGIGTTLKTSDKGYVMFCSVNTPNNSSNAYVIKIDSSGTVEWSNYYDYKDLGLFDYLFYADKLKDGGYIVGGSSVDPVNGNPRIRLAKITENGVLVWDKLYSYYGGGTHDYIQDLVVSNNGDIALTGYITSLPAWQPRVTICSF